MEYKGNRAARVRYAKFLFIAKKYDEAIAEITSLQTSGSTDATLKRLLGYALEEKGDFENAKSAMDAYFVEQVQERIISTDYEYMAKIYAGLAANVPVGANPANYDSLACEMCVKERRRPYAICRKFPLYSRPSLRLEQW